MYSRSDRSRSLEDDERVRGVVKWFSAQSGYGFIKVCDSDREVFVHRSNIANDRPDETETILSADSEVLFSIETGEKGDEAVNVTGPDGEPLKFNRIDIYNDSRRPRRGNFRSRGYSSSSSNGLGYNSLRDRPRQSSRNDEFPMRGYGRDRGSRFIRNRGRGFSGNFDVNENSSYRRPFRGRGRREEDD